jgi:hypothetical protein
MRATTPLSSKIQFLPTVFSALPEVRVGPINLEFPFRQQSPCIRAAEDIRVRRRRTFVTFHFRRFATSVSFRSLASWDDRQFSVVIVMYVSSGCVILYFTDRQVAAVHCWCDIKAAAWNKIERFRLPWIDETSQCRFICIRYF